MSNNHLVTVLTPTFNRGDYLLKLYKSLIKQTNQCFEWMVVDDGSTDGTENKINKFIEEGKIPITYLKQENFGKHVALNLGISQIKTEATFIVDSDDTITEDAIKTIIQNWPSVNTNNLAGIGFLKAYKNNDIIGDSYPKDRLIDSFVNVRLNKNISGDKAEIWATKLLQENPFPAFQGEKYVGEGYVWNKISKFYNMLFINKVIYITEYLDDGLSRAGRKLRIESPLGGMAYANECLSKEFNLKQRIKHTWLYICYGFFAKKNVIEIINGAKNKLFVCINLPFGFALYLFWKIKYLD